MASDASFDIVSKFNPQELDNAISMAMKEIVGRFDFKGSVSKITKEGEDKINLVSEDEFKLKSVIDILQGKLIKRGISLKFLDYGKVEQALGGNAKQTINLKQGITQEKAKEINTLIKDSKIKVKSQIQGDQIRISGKKRDDLQAVIQLLKGKDLKIELQFVNYR